MGGVECLERWVPWGAVRLGTKKPRGKERASHWELREPQRTALTCLFLPWLERCVQNNGMLRNAGCRARSAGSWCNADGGCGLAEEEGWKMKKSGLQFVLVLASGFIKSWTRVPLDQEDDAKSQPVMANGPALRANSRPKSSQQVAGDSRSRGMLARSLGRE